jgi:hypothetical protein
VSAAEVPPQVSAAWSDDAASAAIFELGKLLSGESIAEAQGRDPSDPQKARSNEIAGLIVKVLAPLRALSEEQNRRLDALAAHVATSPLPAPVFIAEGDAFTAGTVDSLDLAGRRISGELDVIEQRRVPMDMTIKLSGQIARSLRAGVREHLRPLEERIEALEEGASASGTYVQHRATAGRTTTFCGIEIGLSGAGMTGIHAGANGLPIRWTTDALRVTCPDCEAAQLELEAPPLTGLVHWSPKGSGRGLCGARLAIAEGERGEAIGFPVAFAPREPAPVVDVEHAEAAWKTCRLVPDTMAKMLLVSLEGILGRSPSAAHREALARHLERAAQVARAPEEA